MSAVEKKVRKVRARREKLEAKALEQEKTIEYWFERYDATKTGKMNREELRKLMTAVKREVTSDPAAIVKESNMEKIISWYDLSGDGQIERTELLPAIKKYKSLLKHEVYITELFAKHDADHSGTLPHDQLLTLLNEVAVSMKWRGATEGDAEFVMARCDDDKSGTITLDELGPSIATWKEAAKELPPDQSSSMCVLL